MKPHMQKRFCVSVGTIFSAMIGGLLWVAPCAHASPLYSGTITGIFSAPVTSGINVNADGTTGFLDNSLTAVVSGDGTDTFRWGALDPAPAFPPDHSTLQFSGVVFTNQKADEVFKLGTLTYTNGTSATTTVAFGITLTVAASVPVTPIDPAVVQLTLVGTVNGLVPDPVKDADFITFDVLPLSFNVLEGATATLDLFGYINDDPRVVLAGISLPPDQPGFLAPEPATRALMLVALGMLVFVARHKPGIATHLPLQLRVESRKRPPGRGSEGRGSTS
jgi:hypothetical protein